MSVSPDFVVRQWLQALGALVVSNLSEKEAQAKLAAFVPLLCAEFPAQAFTADSLRFVGRRCKFFPSFAELCEALSAHWATARPVRVALAPPVERETPLPTDEERAKVAAQVEALTAELRSQDAAKQARYRQQVSTRPAMSVSVSRDTLIEIHRAAAKAGNKTSAVRLAMLEARTREQGGASELEQGFSHTEEPGKNAPACSASANDDWGILDEHQQAAE